MGASMDIPFALGSYAWYPESNRDDVWSECPDCLGTKSLKLTLANGDEHTLGCSRCARGYEPPSGKVMYTTYGYAPRRILCNRISGFHQGIPSYTDAPADSSAYRTYPADKLYATAEECEAECVRMAERSAEAEKAKRVEDVQRKRKSLSSSVSYLRTELGRARKEVARRENTLDVLCDMERRKSWKIT